MTKNFSKPLDKTNFLCEVRIPTYNRPILLKRAIQSLINQDYVNWKAIIFDDSTNDESKQLVQSFNDERLLYKKNENRKGAAGNLNQCFQTKGHIKGNYAFVLEDDNYLLSSFISKNIQAINQSNCKVLLRNQLIDKYTGENNIIRLNETTRGYWLSESIYQPIDIHALLFFMEGLSNGGLFWDTSAISDFTVTETTDVSVQENYRTLHLAEPIFFAEEPLAIFSLMDKQLTTRANNSNRNYSRGRQAIVRDVLKKYGFVGVKKAQKIARIKSLQVKLEETLLDGFYFNYRYSLPLKDCIRILAKSFAKFLLVRVH